MSVRSFIVSVLAVLWLWPAAAYGYTRLMREAEEEATLKISRAHREASVPL